MTLARRLAELDWRALEQSLLEHGHARTGPLLTAAETARLAALLDQPGRFRKWIDMERYRFGAGRYGYLKHPLPPLVRTLRTQTYRHLAPIANRCAQALGRQPQYPPTLDAFLRHCAAHGQTAPTPLLLTYDAGGYNRLHQDLYGEVAFPIQLTCFLDRPGVDFGGGAFLLVEQRPRMQSRGEAIDAVQGEIVLFFTAERPVTGPRGVARAALRHGVSRVTWGQRRTLGILFHDAKS